MAYNRLHHTYGSKAWLSPKILKIIGQILIGLGLTGLLVIDCYYYNWVEHLIYIFPVLFPAITKTSVFWYIPFLSGIFIFILRRFLSMIGAMQNPWAYNTAQSFSNNNAFKNPKRKKLFKIYNSKKYKPLKIISYIFLLLMFFGMFVRSYYIYGWFIRLLNFVPENIVNTILYICSFWWAALIFNILFIIIYKYMSKMDVMQKSFDKHTNKRHHRKHIIKR